MAGQYTSSQSRKVIVGVILAAFGIAIVFSDLDVAAAQGCSLVDITACVALDVLRSVFLACCHALPAYLCEHHKLLLGFAHMLASHWRLLCVMVGGA